MDPRYRTAKHRVQVFQEPDSNCGRVSLAAKGTRVVAPCQLVGALPTTTAGEASSAYSALLLPSSPIVTCRNDKSRSNFSRMVGEAKLRELQAKFQCMNPQAQKEYVLVLQMAEEEGLISPPLSQTFLALLKPESQKQ